MGVVTFGPRDPISRKRKCTRCGSPSTPPIVHVTPSLHSSSSRSSSRPLWPHRIALAVRKSGKSKRSMMSDTVFIGDHGYAWKDNVSLVMHASAAQCNGFLQKRFTPFRRITRRAPCGAHCTRRARPSGVSPALFACTAFSPTGGVRTPSFQTSS